MEQKTGIKSLYDEFFRGYGAEIRLLCPDFRPNSRYKPTPTISRSVPGRQLATLKCAQQSVQQLRPEGWHAVVLKLDRGLRRVRTRGS
jgi:hypothetical protein